MLRALAVLCSVAGLTLLPRVASATTFDDLAVDQLARASDVVVRGRVVAIEARPRGPSGLAGIHTRVVLAVDDVLSGTVGTELVFWVQGGRVGDVMRVVHGQARFTAGEEVVAFLFRSPRGDLWPTGMARGKWLVERHAGGIVVSPSVPLLASSGADDAAPDVRSTIAVEDLRALVRAATGAR